MTGTPPPTYLHTHPPMYSHMCIHAHTHTHTHIRPLCKHPNILTSSDRYILPINLLKHLPLFTLMRLSLSLHRTYPDHKLGPGEYFGERALITGDPRAANIVAVTNVVLMAIDRVSFNSLLGKAWPWSFFCITPTLMIPWHTARLGSFVSYDNRPRKHIFSLSHERTLTSHT